MKHLTKQWMQRYLAACALCCLKASKYAEQGNDAAYEHALKKQQTIFVQDKLSLWTNKSHIDSDSELNMYAKELFSSHIKTTENVLSYLPDSILKRISAPRFLALGFCKADEVKLIDYFCEKLFKKIEADAEAARAETECAQDCLPEELELDDWFDAVLLEIKYNKDDLILRFLDNLTLCVKNAKIVFKENSNVYEYKESNPFTGETRLCTSELNYDESKKLFTLDILFDNRSENGTRNFWYLTVKGDYLYTI